MHNTITVAKLELFFSRVLSLFYINSTILKKKYQYIWNQELKPFLMIQTNRKTA